MRTTSVSAPMSPTIPAAEHHLRASACDSSLAADVGVAGQDQLAAGARIDHGLLRSVEAERRVRRRYCPIDVVLINDDRNSDFGGGDHLDVDTDLGERREEPGSDPRVRSHADTDD